MLSFRVLSQPVYQHSHAAPDLQLPAHPHSISAMANCRQMGGMCSFEVDVLVPAGVSPGTYLNTTSDLLQNGLLVSIPATANLTLEPPPTFNKAFAPSTVGLNGPNTVSTLTFTIDNTASSLAATALDFTR